MPWVKQTLMADKTNMIDDGPSPFRCPNVLANYKCSFVAKKASDSRFLCAMHNQLGPVQWHSVYKNWPKTMALILPLFPNLLLIS